jgi:hypothetical protein
MKTRKRFVRKKNKQQKKTVSKHKNRIQTNNKTKTKNKTKNKVRTKNKTMKKKHSSKIYTKEDYNSGDGMLTSVWGPSLWHFLHTMSFNYPVNPSVTEIKNYKNFITSLKHILPCKYCRMNLIQNFKALPITQKVMKNRNTFSKYIYDLHEHVNKMLGKKSGLSYNDVRERYEHFRSRCTLNPDSIINSELHLNIHDIKDKGKTKSKNGKEKGCTEPLYGKKSKCIIKIVPQETKCETFQIDKHCIKYKS